VSDGAEPEPGLGAVPTPAEVDLLGPLVRDMQSALRSEFGAYSLYLVLPLLARNLELRALLRQLRREQRDQIEGLRGLIVTLGGQAPRSRWTRAVAAWALFLATPVLGLRFALRICSEAERTVSRWYFEYAIHLAERGYLDSAQRCRELGETKHIHATRLSAFVNHLGGD
jgi:hypothetical protein